MSEPTTSIDPVPPAAPADPPLPLLVLRAAVGGTFMGLANLVPGISGGTMLLASGVYPRFVQAIAELTTLRFRLPSMAVLGAIVAAAGAAILLLAGPVKELVVEHRWATYALFIGLTLGGVPVLWRMIGRPDRQVWIGAAVGTAVMAGVALLQSAGVGTGAGGGSGDLLLLFVGGVLGASAMILPGVSGGYLLLVMGLYVPILSAIDRFGEALRALDLRAAMEPALWVLAPVGVGVVLGVVGVSNLLRVLLARYERPTLGVLLGLLVGAVFGLWPFQRGVPPEVGDVVRGSVVTAGSLATLAPEDWPTAYFAPTAGHLLGAVGLVAVGFAVTVAVSWLGRERPPRP